MPAMPRQNKKATKIAFDIIGTPANLRKQKGRKPKKLERYEMMIDVEVADLPTP